MRVWKVASKAARNMMILSKLMYDTCSECLMKVSQNEL